MIHGVHITFIKIECNIYSLLIRSNSNIGILDIKPDITAVQIEGTQFFKISFKFRLAVLVTGEEFIPRGIIIDIKKIQKAFFSEFLVSDDINLLNTGGTAFGKLNTQLHTVAWKFGYQNLNKGLIFTSGVVEISKSPFHFRNFRTIQRFTDTNTHVVYNRFYFILLYILVAGKFNG